MFYYKMCSRYLVILSASLCICTLTSCDPAVWAGLAAGMAGYSTPTRYYGSTSTVSSSYNSSSTSSSSSSSSSRRTCSRCGGTGNCKTCGGSGQVYGYGSASVISKEKYLHKCGVCNGRGRCGVCDGKGYF